MRRKVLVILESRATYGYSKNVMLAMNDFQDLELLTLVTGMHLMAEFGKSVDLIEKDGFPITATVPMNGEGDRCSSWAGALGTAIKDYAECFESLSPDLILLSGDRVETFGCCVAAAYMGIPIAHIQAGDKSGHIDDSARHAIGKFSHVHLASCEDSVQRLIRMGEQVFRIFNVGAPQLDDIVGQSFRMDSIHVDGQCIDLTRPFLLLVQHSVLVERDEAEMQMLSTLRACEESGLPLYWIYPNSDLGYKQIVKIIERGRRSSSMKVLQNIPREQYLALLAHATVLVGNSSSGILEAPSFKIPVVNIGNRQRGRPQASNIVNCGHDTLDIAQSIYHVLHDREFKRACSTAVNPYGDGKSSRRICEILSTLSIDKKLLDKECTY